MRILVVMGGLSSEREISIKTGNNIFEKLKKIYPQTEKYILEDLKDFYQNILSNQYDFIFLALHGKYGEDGIIQAFLESLNIPFSFSSYSSSLTAINKMMTNLLINHFIKNYNIYNLHIPKTVYIKKQEYNQIDTVIQKLKDNFLTAPIIIKPNISGSSYGLSLIKKLDSNQDIENLKNSIELAFKEDSTIIIQEYIEGREITVGVIQKDSEIIPLEPCEIILQDSETFDFENKYIKKVDHIIPPELPEEILSYLKNISSRIFEFMDFKDAIRIDYRLKPSNNSYKVYFLEINTIPGFTEVSLLPQEAEKTGIPFEELLKIIIANNIKK